jgi:hypothetical protein
MTTSRFVGRRARRATFVTLGLLGALAAGAAPAHATPARATPFGHFVSPLRAIDSSLEYVHTCATILIEAHAKGAPVPKSCEALRIAGGKPSIVARSTASVLNGNNYIDALLVGGRHLMLDGSIVKLGSLGAPTGPSARMLRQEGWHNYGSYDAACTSSGFCCIWWNDGQPPRCGY